MEEVRNPETSALPGDPVRARWTDISVPVREGMPQWPGDPQVKIKRLLDVAQGDRHTLTGIEISSHTGTHVDAPRHFIRSGAAIDRMPLDMMMGRARVIEIRDRESIKPEELVRFRIRPGERILLKTENSARLWRSDAFSESYVYITSEAAQFLVQRKIRLVGVDYLSVGSFQEGEMVHSILLEAGIWVVEGLDLARVSAGRYELICLPLKIQDGDGAPARAIVRPRAVRF
ncbi:MAG: cyclase family protein [Chloroflexi bacterium]|nr:cyclase family protein [Chloroflexota bacterium]